MDAGLFHRAQMMADAAAPFLLWVFRDKKSAPKGGKAGIRLRSGLDYVVQRDGGLDVRVRLASASVADADCMGMRACAAGRLGA